MKIKQNQSLTEDKSIISNLNYTTNNNNNTSLNSSQTSTTPTAKQTLKKKKTSLCVSNTNEYTKMMDTQQINPDLINNNQNETLNSQDTSISEEIVDDSSRTRSIGISTDTSDLAPCEPGTNILLEGIVWNETNKGVLILNVSWRGKTFVGSLIDTSKTSWAPPRFKDIPKFKNNKDGFNFFNQYGSNNLFSSTDPSFNPFVTQAGQNGLSTDPTVRTLRNGKRRFINQFENDLMSDLEFDLCNNSQNNGVSNNNNINNNNNGPTTPVNQPVKQETKIKSESHSSASSVNEEEFDAMTQSSTTSSTSSKCSSKSNGKKAKLNNGDAKSTSSNSSSNSSRSYKKNKKSNLDQTLNSSNLDDTLSSSLIQGRQTPVQEQFITSQHQQQNNLTDQSTMNEIKT
ncbi:unnamed protein product [Brachionus calyciflorus]|uniref:Uncharacterized protein n=1 Tax=Brachionus calyciflorus TaxID=104777 RepID=A0A813WZQ7_9BILA|nr:unnamed protein product [Brachionus calyciflorus]